ncbi:hypothetical protein VF14_36445 [Nostoc linckia z18]|uniref:Uncharacterized protein n=3 Tax=Nostoc TaxID=1177 RepID=A0A9Q5Z4G4_NOSLI|nr:MULTISPECIES: hypothetical protein [Nostoc]PHK27144.1 hypothetical protein VF12_35685 [Nostoc linckia z15]PHK38384.1 hypothetical protein VF13_36090 [Nostoc linckia z16]MBD2616062.1 hypothetical protein [Nostoc punctiforme FACHB-252]PHJ52684.1 hypothetical protein VF02_37555 [Nostoc linckia z1]PHJ56085.1 hypothetical protein VF05_37675 [Nostoc linckia z3]
MNKPPERKKSSASTSPKPKPTQKQPKQETPEVVTVEVAAVEVPELTPQEQRDRARLEEKVETAFYEAGKALMELRDRRLYRSTHKTFEEYCRDRFGYSRDAAYLKISATSVYENIQKYLPTNGRQIPLPTSERQVRSLAKAELEPPQQAHVWEQAVQEAGNKIPSGRIVKDVVDRIREQTKIPNPYREGEICVLLPKDNPDLRGKGGCWGVVTYVGDYSCTVQTWDEDHTVKIEHLKSLELLDDDCKFMQQLCLRLRRLHQVADHDVSVDWLLQGLGKQAKPYLSALQARLLAAMEREYGLDGKQKR